MGAGGFIFSPVFACRRLAPDFSRTAWLAAGTALLVFQGREWKPLLLRLAIMLLCFLVFPPLRTRLYPPGGLWQDSTVAYRRQIWEASWELFKETKRGTGSGGSSAPIFYSTGLFMPITSCYI